MRYYKGPDFSTGYGALDVAEALRLVQAGRIVENELTTSALHQYTVTVPGGVQASERKFCTKARSSGSGPRHPTWVSKMLVANSGAAS